MIEKLLRFNPLTGIRSFLTHSTTGAGTTYTDARTFQSPHGDSFLSDYTNQTITTRRDEMSFNPLTGIRSFLTTQSKSY